LSPQAQPKARKRGKYNAIRTETSDGFFHASKKEAARWVFLRDLEDKEVISELERQIRFPLHVQGVRIGTYVADARYVVARTNERIVEDTKSKATITALFRRNKKHMKIEYGVDVKEVFEWNTPV
jgi:hypothetical protein